MKLGNPTDTKVEGSDDFTSHDFRISDANSAHVFRMLTDYSDPIGSVVREITSNCFDAHEKAGVDRDVVIRMSKGTKLDGTDAQIQFEDFGTGLTPELVKDIFTVLGESTKRETNSELGAFGIGAKSPFGYVRSRDLGGFLVDTYVDGTHWQYFLAESAENGPQMTEILKEDTDRTNGTIVTVPIDKGDFYSFKRSLREQLAYFDNIKFEVQNVSSDYTIYRGENFIYRPDNQPYDEIHACFGKVAYPLDYRKLDWPTGYGSDTKMNAPIALLFDIGSGIQVTPNREQIQYTDSVIQTIENKIDAVRKEFHQMWQDAHSGIDTIKGLIKARENKDSNTVQVKGVDIPHSKFILEDHSITMEGYEDITVPSDIFYMFRTHKSIDSDGYVNSNARLPRVNDVIEKDTTYLVDGKYSSKTNRYIASRYGENMRSNWHIIKKIDFSGSIKSRYIIDDPAEDDWDPDDEDNPFSREKPPIAKCENPELHRARERYDNHWCSYGDNRKDYKEITEKELRKIIEFEKMVIDYVEDKVRDYNEVEVSEDFEEYEKKKREQKEKQKKQKRENQFPIKILEKSGSYGEDYKWKMDDMRYDSLDDSTMYVYGFQEDDDDLLKIGDIIWSNNNFQKDRYSSIDRKKIAVLKIAMKREYLFEDLDNAMHISDFQDGHKIIDRAYHAQWIQDQIWNVDIGRERTSGWKTAEVLFPDLYAKKKEIGNFIGNYGGISLNKDYYGVEVSDDAKKNWKYSEDLLKVIKNTGQAIESQLPLIDGIRIRNLDWEEFQIYVDNKDLVHPRIWCKKEGIID